MDVVWFGYALESYALRARACASCVDVCVCASLSMLVSILLSSSSLDDGHI